MSCDFYTTGAPPKVMTHPHQDFTDSGFKCGSPPCSPAKSASTQHLGAERLSMLATHHACAPFKPSTWPCRLRMPGIASTNAPCRLQQRVQPFTSQHTRHQNHISIHLMIVQIISNQSDNSLSLPAVGLNGFTQHWPEGHPA